MKGAKKPADPSRSTAPLAPKRVERARFSLVEVVQSDNLQPGPGPARPGFWSIAIVTNGIGVLQRGRRSLPLSVGDVVIVKDAEPHRYTKAGGLCVTHVLFDYRRLKVDRWEAAQMPAFQLLFRGQETAAGGRTQLDSYRLNLACALAREIARELQEGWPLWRTMTRSHFEHLVVLLCRFYEETSPHHAKNAPRIAKVLEFLEKHYGEDIDIPALAPRFGMSLRSFYRSFLQATRMSPRTFLGQLRLSKAAAMLQETELSVTEIAFRCGFEDGNYFTRKFHRVHGISPTGYRATWQE